MPAKPPRRRFSRRRFAQLAGGGLIAGSTGWAYWGEPFRTVRKDVTLTIPGLPAGLDGLKIAQLTDFHFESESQTGMVKELIDLANGFKPDIVALTGDYISNEDQELPPADALSRLAGLLSRLRSRHGTYCCYGNHDVWHGRYSMLRASMSDVGIVPLINESVRIKHSGVSLPIFGTDSAWGGRPRYERALQGIEKGEFALGLVHEPDCYDEVRALHPRLLQLSGHTHGGQCRVPFISYAPIKVHLGRKYILGHYEKEDSHLYVSSGVGTAGLRVRFACPPEVVCMTVVGD